MSGEKKVFTFEKWGYIFTTFDENGGPILSVKHGQVEIKLGQRVYSNGRIWYPAGTLGLVVNIRLPFERGRSYDILDVFFEGDSTSAHMKFKDLQLPTTVKSA